MNSTRDNVFKRCSCTDGKTGQQLAGRCPRLAEPRHGSWYYALADLTGKRLQACFNLLSRQRTRNGTPVAASTVDRVRATLWSALNAAVREDLIASDPLAQVRLDKPFRPPGHLDRRARRGLAPRRCPPASRALDAAAARHLPEPESRRTGSRRYGG